ncbi:MAG: S41 family peptidase [Limisphaerales bacterium]
MKTLSRILLLNLIALLAASPPFGLRANDTSTPGRQGYYRFPTIFGDTVVFTAEGDLWRVSAQGGMAQRLTSHLGLESHAAFSPDGKTLAFSAHYEGPGEVYTMPAEGGLPTRRTFEGSEATVVGWTPDGKILYSTLQYSTLPDRQLVTLDASNGEPSVLPLSQASDGVFDPSGKTLYFTRLPFQGSSTKRYKGGFVQQLWKYTAGDAEAVPLTAYFDGTSKQPVWWEGRIYFVSDRDGSMNLWSMNADGGDLRQHTHHRDWDVKSPALAQGRIVYQLGPDLHLYDIAANADRVIPIALASDFDQERQKWIKAPMEYLTAVHLSPDGDRLVLTARGEVFVAPAEQGRFVNVTHQPDVRYRNACFLPDGKSLLALSDATSELEFYRLPANGVGQAGQLTSDGHVFRFAGVPSSDGKWIAYDDKNLDLWVYDVESKRNTRIATARWGGFGDLAWSPDSKWLAYVRTADNTYPQLWVYGIKDGSATALTSERVNSYSPAWSTDGKWIYFLSERHLETAVTSPWGLREPEPFFDRPVNLYSISLLSEQRSPFQTADELHLAQPDKKNAKDKDKEKPKTEKDEKSEDKEANPTPDVKIDLPGIESRVQRVPVPPGNYSDLSADAKHLFLVEHGAGLAGRTNLNLMTLEITNTEPKLKTLAESVKGYELSQDRKKILMHKDDSFYIIDSDSGPPAKLEKSVSLKDWSFPVEPRQEWRQMFVEAWRLERDFFYDRNMQGVDWPAILKRYLPTADRVTDRGELSDLIAEMVGELSALHIFVFGGDLREASEQIEIATLGASLLRDPVAGGYRVSHISQTDPDYPEDLSPLARPGVDVHEGDIIEMINGVAALSAPDPLELLRNQAGRQVLLRVRTPGAAASRETVVNPISVSRQMDLRYDEWEYQRRQKVEQWGKGDIGYLHLRAMGPADIARWARDYYPVFQRQGLIIDVRHNNGGNIDSWLLEKLMRKAWFYWQDRVGEPFWNMQYAFRGHVVVLCDQETASDGEAFSEGFKRLGLGKLIGMRTWGGEIWLSFDTQLSDNGMASAAETGVYGPEGKWLIEGHGVDPDIIVDNLPHATFQGEDAQLKKAVEYLREEIRKNPAPTPSPPPYPDKSLHR